MAAKIGIIAESTDNSTGTVTVYTVPADKAARIRVMIQTTGSGGSGSVAFMIGPEGSQTIFSTDQAAEHEMWTGFRFDETDGYPKDIGIHSAQEGWAVTTTTAEKSFICPLPVDYYLSTGDTIKIVATSSTIGDALLFQVVGVEDDA
jgi:hypothetical protein